MWNKYSGFRPNFFGNYTPPITPTELDDIKETIVKTLETGNFRFNKLIPESFYKNLRNALNEEDKEDIHEVIYSQFLPNMKQNPNVSDEDLKTLIDEGIEKYYKRVNDRKRRKNIRNSVKIQKVFSKPTRNGHLLPYNVVKHITGYATGFPKNKKPNTRGGARKTRKTRKNRK